MASSPAETCWTVLRAAASGDAAAKSTFYEVYADAIRDFFRARWRGRVLASESQDACQEVLFECLKPGGVLERADETRGHFRALLFSVSRNVARRFEEKFAARGRLQSEDSAWLRELASESAGPSTLFDRSWAQAIVRQAKELQRDRASADGAAGERRLELLERRFGSDEAIREIAARWGIPTQDVHNAYRKARTEFYACLREALAFHTASASELDAECRLVLASLGPVAPDFSEDS